MHYIIYIHHSHIINTKFCGQTTLLKMMQCSMKTLICSKDVRYEHQTNGMSCYQAVMKQKEKQKQIVWVFVKAAKDDDQRV